MLGEGRCCPEEGGREHSGRNSVRSLRTLLSGRKSLIIQSSAPPPVDAVKVILVPSGDQSMWRFWVSLVRTPVLTSRGSPPSMGTVQMLLPGPVYAILVPSGDQASSL